MQKKFSVLQVRRDCIQGAGDRGRHFRGHCLRADHCGSLGRAAVDDSVIGTGDYVDMGSAGFAAGLFGAVLVLVGGLIGALCIYALGELINLLLAVEENTRASALASIRERGTSQNVERTARPATFPSKNRRIISVRKICQWSEGEGNV